MTLRAKTILYLTATLTLFLVGTRSPTSAQVQRGKSVFAGGAGFMSNTKYAAAGTIGQSVIGRSVGATYAANGGFWGDGGLTVAVKEQPEAEMPVQFALLQNYPNPFNPSTTIRYALPNKSNVTMFMYNALGQKVAELVSGEIEAGYHVVNFDASSLPSGVYFYRLQAGSYVETKRLLLLR